MTTKAIDVPTLTDRLRDNAISAGVDAITAAMCVDAADYIDALEADLGKRAMHYPGHTPAIEAAARALCRMQSYDPGNPAKDPDYVEHEWHEWIPEATAALEAAEPHRAVQEPVGWRDIESAPKDRWIIVYAAPAHGLPGFVTPCLWHPDGGFCVDELRNATLWQDLPAAPPTPQEPTD